MRRQLGNMEAALHLTGHFAPMSVAGVVQLRGAPEVEKVRAGLDVLQQMHPLLRARIVIERRRPWFDVSPEVPPVPLEVLPRRDATHWRDVVAEGLNRNLDIENGPLLACTYLRGATDAGSDLVFAYDHTIMDGVSGWRFCDQLLRLCGGTLDADDLAQVTLQPSIDELLPDGLTGRARLAALARFMRRQSADELNYRRHIHGRAAPVQPDAHCRILTRSLDVDSTNDLVSRARRRRLTMNSVIAAALLCATHRHLYHDQDLPMRAITFADLRPTLRPVPSADVLGCYISMLRHTIRIQPGDDLWTVAQAVQDEVQGSITRSEHLLSAGLAKQLMTMIIKTKRMRMSTTAISYAGPLLLAESYGDIEVTAVNGFVANNRLGPVSSAFVKIFRGRLEWDFVVLDTDMDASTADRIADSTIDELVRAPMP